MSISDLIQIVLAVIWTVSGSVIGVRLIAGMIHLKKLRDIRNESEDVFRRMIYAAKHGDYEGMEYWESKHREIGIRIQELCKK